MLTENEKMTLYIKDRLKKAAANTVIQEVILAIFNSYERDDNENSIIAYFEEKETPLIHEYFTSEYNKALNNFFSLGEAERNKILDSYILKELEQSN